MLVTATRAHSIKSLPSQRCSFCLRCVCARGRLLVEHCIRAPAMSDRSDKYGFSFFILHFDTILILFRLERRRRVYRSFHPPNASKWRTGPRPTPLTELAIRKDSISVISMTHGYFIAFSLMYERRASLSIRWTNYGICLAMRRSTRFNEKWKAFAWTVSQWRKNPFGNEVNQWTSTFLKRAICVCLMIEFGAVPRPIPTSDPPATHNRRAHHAKSLLSLN